MFISVMIGIQLIHLMHEKFSKCVINKCSPVTVLRIADSQQNDQIYLVSLLNHILLSSFGGRGTILFTYKSKKLYAVLL